MMCGSVLALSAQPARTASKNGRPVADVVPRVEQGPARDPHLDGRVHKPAIDSA